MTPRTVCVAACLGLAVAVAPPRESVAAAKVDLEEYLGGVPMEGDQKVTVSELDEVTDTVESVATSAKRSVIVFSETSANHPGVNMGLEVVVHGKRRLLGSHSHVEEGHELDFITPKPKKYVALQLKPGQAYKFSIPQKVFFDGVKVGKGKYFGTITFVGFE